MANCSKDLFDLLLRGYTARPRRKFALLNTRATHSVVLVEGIIAALIGATTHQELVARITDLSSRKVVITVGCGILVLFLSCKPFPGWQPLWQLTRILETVTRMTAIRENIATRLPAMQTVMVSQGGVVGSRISIDGLLAAGTILTARGIVQARLGTRSHGKQTRTSHRGQSLFRSLRVARSHAAYTTIMCSPLSTVHSELMVMG